MAKRVQEQAQVGWETDSQEILQEIRIWSSNQMVYEQTRILLREWDA